MSDAAKSAPNNKEEPILDQEDVCIGGGFNSVEEIKEALPHFLQDQNIKDAHGKRPFEEGYDDTSLFIPQSEWKNFTPAMFQYWEIK